MYYKLKVSENSSKYFHFENMTLNLILSMLYYDSVLITITIVAFLTLFHLVANYISVFWVKYFRNLEPGIKKRGIQRVVSELFW